MFLIEPWQLIEPEGPLRRGLSIHFRECLDFDTFPHKCRLSVYARSEAIRRFCHLGEKQTCDHRGLGKIPVGQ